MKIKINDLDWSVERVDANDSRLYVNGQTCVGATWYTDQTIYISKSLTKASSIVTVRHELVHAFIYSTQVNTPGKYTEEDVCEFVARYGRQITEMADKVIEELYVPRFVSGEDAESGIGIIRGGIAVE